MVQLRHEGSLLHIAADSGLDHARAAGHAVDVAVGDFDSVSDAGLRWAEANGVELIRHDRDKDRTDLELALDLVVDRGVETALVLGGAGGRLDHLLGNLTVLASSRYRAVQIEARMGEASLWVVRGERMLHPEVGMLLSLIPMHGDAEAVETTGLRWPLEGERLQAGSSRGVSNLVAATPVRVAVGVGVVLAVATSDEGCEAWPSR